MEDGLELEKSAMLAHSSTTQQSIPYGGTELAPTNHRCLRQNEVEERIEEASQIIVAMPAKAAGSAMKTFTRQCMQRTFPDNFLNHQDTVINTLLLGDSIALPRVISSHIYTDKPLCGKTTWKDQQDTNGILPRTVLCGPS
jgi:hypothetical protein